MAAIVAVSPAENGQGRVSMAAGCLPMCSHQASRLLSRAPGKMAPFKLLKVTDDYRADVSHQRVLLIVQIKFYHTNIRIKEKD